VLINRFGGLTKYDTRDGGQMNGHTLVIGGSSSGKSYGLQAIEMDNIRLGHGLIVIDRGNSYDQLVRAAGGSVVNLDPAEVSINPFELEEGEEEPDTRHKQFLDNLMAQMLSGNGSTPLDEVDRAILSEAISQVYAMNVSDRGGKRVVEPTYLQQVKRHLNNMSRIGDQPFNDADRERAAELAKRLERWTGRTPLGNFIDRDSTVRLSDNIISFETGALRGNDDLQVVGMMIVTNLILRRLRKDNSPKTIIFEEFRALMDTPEAIKIAVMLFSTARKQGARVVAVNQGAGIFSSEDADGIVQNVSNYLFFRMTGAEKEIAILQSTFNLSDGAVQSLLGLTGIPGVYAEVLVARRRQDGVLEGDVLTIRVSALEHWTYTTSAADKDERSAMIAKHGGNEFRALLELAYGPDVFQQPGLRAAGVYQQSGVSL
jgi:conjugal transfer ATP-binding protein TraC